MKICDFCSDPEPCIVFKAETFILDIGGSPAFGSLGGWGACRECSLLIENKKWEELRVRAVDVFKKKYAGLLSVQQVIELVELSHNAFREHRG